MTAIRTGFYMKPVFRTNTAHVYFVSGFDLAKSNLNSGKVAETLFINYYLFTVDATRSRYLFSS